MAVVRWKPGHFGWHRDPISEMHRFQREMGKLFDVFNVRKRTDHVAGVFPALNVSEDENSLYVRAELPGVAPEQIEITTKEDNLILNGERKIDAESGNVSYHRREREAGTFRRIISLPTRVDTDKITAVCKNGVLTVTLPKAVEIQPRQIRVESR